MTAEISPGIWASKGPTRDASPSSVVVSAEARISPVSGLSARCSLRQLRRGAGIVLGGGLSNVDELYGMVASRLPAQVFSDTCTTPVVRNRHGDSSGVRGAAWLWPAAEA